MNGLEAILNVARAEVGYQEGKGNRTKFGEWYELDGNPWCDMFIAWCAYRAGQLEVVGRYAYTPSHANWFRANNRWGLIPRVGAIVFYKWPGMSRISHVGIVEAVHNDGAYITTIEGNTNPDGSSRTGGGVYRVRRNARASYVAGFGYPAYTRDVVVTTPPVIGRDPRLNDMGNSLRLSEDGDFGPKTKARLQESLNRTGANPSLAIDGDFGPKTKRALQARLNHTNGPVRVDGDVGPKTIRALQANVGTRQDGDWGPMTTRALQTVLNRREL